MFVTQGEFNGNKMIVIKKDEAQEYAAFQSGARKFIPILQALVENGDEVLTVIELIGGEKGVEIAKAFRDKYNVPSKITAAPKKKVKAKA